MFDADFDPYLELQQAKVELLKHENTIRQLCIAHNRNQDIIADLVQQHSQTVNMIKSTRDQMVLLRNEVNQVLAKHT